MSIRKEPQKVKLFFSLFSGNLKTVEETLSVLCELFGETDNETNIIPFDITDYYEREFGKDLKRKLISFKRLISPVELIDFKLKAYELEEKFICDGKRTVNIDPGYVSLSRVVLSTGKDYTHRIYLDKGVYADLTLIYKKGTGFTPLPWTYPDYASSLFLNFFMNVRDSLKKQLKGEPK